MRILGLDIGEKRVGIAVSDPQGRVATPLKVIEGPLSADASRLVRIAEDYDIELVVVGLPRSMDGSEGAQAQRVRAEVATLEGVLSVPVAFHDERLSSAEASRVMTEAGLSEREKRGRLDMVAASIVLQSYLDGLVRTAGSNGESRA